MEVKDSFRFQELFREGIIMGNNIKENWMRKAIRLIERERTPLHEIEENKNGIAVKVLSRDMASDIYLSYKRVMIFDPVINDVGLGLPKYVDEDFVKLIDGILLWIKGYVRHSRDDKYTKWVASPESGVNEAIRAMGWIEDVRKACIGIKGLISELLTKL